MQAELALRPWGESVTVAAKQAALEVRPLNRRLLRRRRSRRERDDAARGHPNVCPYTSVHSVVAWCYALSSSVDPLARGSRLVVFVSGELCRRRPSPPSWLVVGRPET
jgi:hypothetical protein